MDLRVLYCALLGAVCVSGRVDHHREDNQVVYFNSNDKGAASNCGDAKHNFTLEWEPKKLVIGGMVKVHFSFVPAEDYSGGHVDGSVWLPNYPDPVFTFKDVNLLCSDIHKFFPTMCPFKKGQRVEIPPVSVPLTPTQPLPSGTFIVQAKLYNQDKKQMLCMKATLEVTDGD